MDPAEYLGAAPTNETHVIRLYRAYLGRYPSSGEIAYCKGELDSGRRTLADLRQVFSDSTEFTAKLNEFF